MRHGFRCEAACTEPMPEILHTRLRTTTLPLLHRTPHPHAFHTYNPPSLVHATFAPTIIVCLTPPSLVWYSPAALQH